MVGWRRRSFVLRFHKPKRLRKQCSSGGRRVNLLSWQNQSFIKWITVWQSLFWYRHTERQTDPEDPAGTHLSRDRLSCAGARQACEFQIIKSHCVRTLQHSCITSADVFNVLLSLPVSQVRNEPSNIVLSCRHIAKVKGLSPQTVQQVTAQNAYRLFPKANRR